MHDTLRQKVFDHPLRMLTVLSLLVNACGFENRGYHAGFHGLGDPVGVLHHRVDASKVADRFANDDGGEVVDGSQAICEEVYEPDGGGDDLGGDQGIADSGVTQGNAL